MQKVLRIVRKDALHLWPEILLTLALTAGFAATEHFGWPSTRPPHLHQQAETLRMWMNILMPFSWWLLIGRAVQDESLVGDRQFWVTRPYGWQRLLAAKLLFVAIFILLPLLMAQMFLLHQAGLHVLPAISGLLLGLFPVCATFLLPFLALSVVTPTIIRMFLVFLGMVVYTALIFYFALNVGNQVGWRPGGDETFSSVAYLLPLVAAGVIVLQYARRRTLISSAILISYALLFTAAGLANVYVDRGASGYEELGPNEKPPVMLGLNSDVHYQTNAVDVGTELSASVPIVFSGVAPGHALRIIGVKETVEGTGLQTLNVPWNPVGEYFVDEDTTRIENVGKTWLVGSIRFSGEGVSPGDKLANTVVTIHLTYAVEEYQLESPIIVGRRGKAFDVPQDGRCVSNGGDLMGDCLYAHSPDLTRVSYSVRQNCTTSAGGHNEELWIGGNTEMWEDPEFSPVSVVPVVAYGPSAAKLNCPVNVLSFERARLLRRRLIHLTLPSIDLRPYMPDLKTGTIQ